MVFITVEDYKTAGLNVKKDSENCFWVKMKDVQDGLGIKNISDRLERTMQGIFESKKITKEQKQKYVRSKNGISKKF